VCRHNRHGVGRARIAHAELLRKEKHKTALIASGNTRRGAARRGRSRGTRKPGTDRRQVSAQVARHHHGFTTFSPPGAGGIIS